jgi:hypothetical protein
MYFDGRSFEGDYDPGPRRPGSKVIILRPFVKFFVPGTNNGLQSLFRIICLKQNNAGG